MFWSVFSRGGVCLIIGKNSHKSDYTKILLIGLACKRLCACHLREVVGKYVLWQGRVNFAIKHQICKQIWLQ